MSDHVAELRKSIPIMSGVFPPTYNGMQDEARRQVLRDKINIKELYRDGDLDGLRSFESISGTPKIDKIAARAVRRLEKKLGI